MKQALFALFILLSANSAHAACTGLYDFRFTTLQGGEVNLCDYQARPILVVNTASKCGFAPQFGRLEDMYKKYKEKGLLIVGFPSNDFRQEFVTNKEIGDFCKKNYAVEFPMATKSSVVGPDANLLFKQLIEITSEPPMWNFYKYLILPGGTQVYAYSSDVDPESAQVMDKLKPYIK